MHSATTLEGLVLFRTVGSCAQTWVAIETHSRTSGAMYHAFQEACSAGH